MSIWSKLFGDVINLDFEAFKADVVAAVKTEAKAQFDVYFPQLLGLAKTELHDLFEQWMPILMTGLSKAAVSTAVKLGEASVDKLTDLTPTQLDDQIVDPIARELFDWLGTVFSGQLAPKPPAP
jgi:hypothetical protein